MPTVFPTRKPLRAAVTLRTVFYSVPSRLIGHRPRVRLHDDRLDVFVGGTHLMTLPRVRSHNSGRHGYVVDYRHVIHAGAAPTDELVEEPAISG